MYPKAICNNATIYIQDNFTGDITELGLAESVVLTEIVDSYDSFTEKNIEIPQSHKVSLTYRPKSLTKKRFIKMLMSYKMQRNEANAIAKICFKNRGYYSYIDLLFFIGGGRFI